MLQGQVPVVSTGERQVLQSLTLYIYYSLCIQHLWMHRRTFTSEYVLCYFTKSTWNWISVDLQRYSISLHVLGLSITHHPSSQELSTCFQLWNSHLHIASSFHTSINTWILHIFKSPTDKQTETDNCRSPTHKYMWPSRNEWRPIKLCWLWERDQNVRGK